MAQPLVGQPCTPELPCAVGACGSDGTCQATQPQPGLGVCRHDLPCGHAGEACCLCTYATCNAAFVCDVTTATCDATTRQCLAR